MFHFLKSCAPSDTFPSESKDRRELEFVEMGEQLPFYAVSVQLENRTIRWLLIAGPSALARVHKGVMNGFEALALYQLDPDFKNGIDLDVKRVNEWDAVVRITTDNHSSCDYYPLGEEVLMPYEP